MFPAHNQVAAGRIVHVSQEIAALVLKFNLHLLHTVFSHHAKRLAMGHAGLFAQPIYQLLQSRSAMLCLAFGHLVALPVQYTNRVALRSSMNW